MWHWLNPPRNSQGLDQVHSDLQIMHNLLRFDRLWDFCKWLLLGILVLEQEWYTRVQ